MKNKSAIFLLLISLVISGMPGCDNTSGEDDSGNIPVSGVSLNKTATVILEGETERLFAMVSPLDATSHAVAWASDDETVATVSSDGLVTAVAPGTAEISVITDDGGYQAFCDVSVSSVPVRVSGITLNVDTLTLGVDAAGQLSIVFTPDNATNQNLIWESSNDDVALVSSGGLVLGMATGSATITVTSEDSGDQAQCEVSVTDLPTAVRGVKLNKETTSLLVSNSEQLYYQITPSNTANQDVIWESSDEAVATVSEEGLVTAIGIGEASVTVTTADGGYQDECVVTVSLLPVYVTGISLNTASLSMYADATEQLSAEIDPSDATNQGLLWYSNDEEVAVVSEGGLVTAVAEGTTFIAVVTDDGGFEDQCVVTVSPAPVPVTGISLTKDEIRLKSGDTEQLTAVISPVDADNQDVAWDSDDDSIVTVSPDGLVTAVGPGTTNITVTTEDGGYTDQCVVTVPHYKYVAAAGAGIKIFDVSDPLNPVVVGSCDDVYYAMGIEVKGDYAYVGGSFGLSIVDVSDVENPVFITRFDTSSGVLGLTVRDNYAYCAIQYDGIVIVNIENPASPILVGSIDTSERSNDVAASDNYLYVATNYAGLTVMDITDPSSPTVVGVYNTPGRAMNVKIIANIAYVADGSGGLLILDISDPSVITLVGNYDTEGTTNDVVIVDHYAYIADGTNGLVVLDISDPSAITLVGGLDVDAAFNALSLSVAGNYAYIASGTDGLTIVDIEENANPYYAGGYDLSSDTAMDVETDETYAYVADDGMGLVIIDITDPQYPVRVGRFDTIDAVFGRTQGVCLRGDTVYLATTIGLVVVDVSDRSNPILLGGYNTPGWANNVTVRDNYAYVSDYYYGLTIVDVSDPENLVMVGGCDLGSIDTCLGVAVNGDYAYVVTEDYGLYIVNIQDPADPTFVSNYHNSTDNIAANVMVRDNYAYVAYGDSGLEIINISDPSNPTLVLQINNPHGGDCRDLKLIGDYIYIVDNCYLTIIDVSNPESAYILSECFVLPQGYGISISDDFAYIASYAGGFCVVDISDINNPISLNKEGIYNTIY